MGAHAAPVCVPLYERGKSRLWVKRWECGALWSQVLEALLQRYGRSWHFSKRPALDKSRAIGALDDRSFQLARARQLEEDRRVRRAGGGDSSGRAKVSGALAFEQQDRSDLEAFLTRHYTFV